VQERHSRELHDGAGDAFAAAFEMIVTPAIFGLLGWFIDSRLGLFPVFTLALAGLVLGYQVWKLYVKYSADMDAALEQRRATYGQPPSATGGAAS
jgi:Putative F0F1-ATPase subunit Ca2+/Mg2+ transporter